MKLKLTIEASKLSMILMWIVSIAYSILLTNLETNENYYKLHTLIVLAFVIAGFVFLYRHAIDNKIVFVFMILIYYFFTQFGMCMVYYLIDNKIETQFGSSGVFYLQDSFYLKNLAMALLGFTSTIFGAVLVADKRYSAPALNDVYYTSNSESRVIGFIGLGFLALAALYFSYYVAIGRIHFGMDYSLYRNSGVIDGIYEWIIVFYMIGSCFVYASCEGLRLKFGMLLFGYTALILLAFGNRGEVLYPLLACFGIYIIKRRKIPVKLIIASFLILFLLIPFIKIFRHIGSMSMSEVIESINPWGGLAEMGVSMRMTTYIMSELKSGTRKLLLGFSYLNPIVNMLDHLVPVSIRLTPPASFNFTNDFYAMKSMTTVAESYANFGAIGVVLHHVIMGAMMAALERNDSMKSRLALASSIGSVFIYSIRARIQSVPIEIFVCFMIYLFVRFSSGHLSLKACS